MGDSVEKPDPRDESATWSFVADSLSDDFAWPTTELHHHDVDVDGYQLSDGTTHPLAAAASAAAASTVDAFPTTSNPSVSSSSSEEKTTGVVKVAPPPEAETSTKVKKKGQKRVRQQRFAFMTKSDVDHLEDGYRWRKYGQKAVKNSPFPRSYYRCTNSKCTVKKRVERSSEDPTVVITTYEGQHCHHTVGFPRSTGFIAHEGAFLGHFGQPTSQYYYPGIQFSQESSVSLAQGSVSSIHSHDQQALSEVRESSSIQQSTEQQPPPRSSSSEGLLGDIVPPGMRNPYDM